MSPNRFQSQTREWVYRFLVLRDGEFCQICGKVPAPINSSRKKIENTALDIDHKDNDKRNSEPQNLQLLCRTCNVKKENLARAGKELFPSALCVCERTKAIDNVNPATRMVKERVRFSEDTPATMQANFMYEHNFRTWLLAYIDSHGSILKRDAIDSGAELAGASPSTTARYLTKLTSLVGVLMETPDMLGNTVLTYKPEYQERKP